MTGGRETLTMKLVSEVTHVVTFPSVISSLALPDRRLHGEYCYRASGLISDSQRLARDEIDQLLNISLVDSADPIFRSLQPANSNLVRHPSD